MLGHIDGHHLPPSLVLSYTLPPSLSLSDSVGESSESEPSEVFALLITCFSQFCQSLAFIVLAVVVPREPGWAGLIEEEERGGVMSHASSQCAQSDYL